ncbi:hypothetical protein Pcinc_023949 [Petrolisthes cinctipes]|uniref:Uncharacterized protein n=1 Tax=Petrolisthes cinctipes TaxID=88211 RepID=A0AAE1KDR3_PETCI|nr:hypothetical protein Pcinc_023949 [Petrolisthes cinctipes]
MCGGVGSEKECVVEVVVWRQWRQCGRGGGGKVECVLALEKPGAGMCRCVRDGVRVLCCSTWHGAGRAVPVSEAVWRSSRPATVTGFLVAPPSPPLHHALRPHHHRHLY